MRNFLFPLPGLLAISCALAQSPPAAALSQAAEEKIAKMTPIFDGKSLDGWAQLPPYPVRFSGDDISDMAGLAKKLLEQADPVSAFLGQQFDEAEKNSLREGANPKEMKSALVKKLNAIATGASIHDKDRFKDTALRPETSGLGARNPEGVELARYNRLLLEDAYPEQLARSPAASWAVKDGAMASLGAGRGVIHTLKAYAKYRLVFTMRHLGGPPGEHAPCALVFCTAPPPGEQGLDALGGIQFQPPNGGSWDYRPGKNNGGKGLFTRVVNPKFDSREWHRVELLVDSETGTARMAVAQPPGTRAVEVLDFKDPSAGKPGPIAWQMHNKGLFDEYKDVRIEENPADDKLITVE